MVWWATAPRRAACSGMRASASALKPPVSTVTVVTVWPCSRR